MTYYEYINLTLSEIRTVNTKLQCDLKLQGITTGYTDRATMVEIAKQQQYVNRKLRLVNDLFDAVLRKEISFDEDILDQPATPSQK